MYVVKFIETGRYLGKNYRTGRYCPCSLEKAIKYRLKIEAENRASTFRKEAEAVEI